MDLRPDEIQYAGTIIRAWLSRNCRTWHVSIRIMNASNPKTPRSLTAFTSSHSQTSAWADARDIVDLLYWPNQGRQDPIPHPDNIPDSTEHDYRTTNSSEWSV